MDVSDRAFRIVADLLERRTGQRLDQGRRWRIVSALSIILRDEGLPTVDALAERLNDPARCDLVERTVEALLNNETYFFRDAAMFDLLAAEVLPELAGRRRGTKRLSIWSAGCSTGQEALSLAMLFRDNPREWEDWTIDILGTDVSARAIKQARDARYTQFEIQRGLGIERMLAHFEEHDGRWEPAAPLRAMTRFETANLLHGSRPHRPFDLILCRNVLLYFDTRQRRAALAQVSNSLRADGWLMLGAGEDASVAKGSLQPAKQDARLYVPTARAATFPPSAPVERGKKTTPSVLARRHA